MASTFGATFSTIIGITAVNNNFEQDDLIGYSNNFDNQDYYHNFRNLSSTGSDSNSSPTSSLSSSLPSTPTNPNPNTNVTFALQDQSSSSLPSSSTTSSPSHHLMRRSSESIVDSALHFKKQSTRRYTLPSLIINPFNLIGQDKDKNKKSEDSSVQVAMENFQFGL